MWGGRSSLFLVAKPEVEVARVVAGLAQVASPKSRVVVLTHRGVVVSTPRFSYTHYSKLLTVNVAEVECGRGRHAIGW